MCACARVNMIFGKRGEKGMWKQGERILDSDQFIERYQPAGQQPRGCGALPDLWLPDNTTARGFREAETALFVLKLTGKSCVVPVKMDIFISADQMGVTSTGPEHWGTTPFRGEQYLFVPPLLSTVGWCEGHSHTRLLRNDWRSSRCVTPRR